MLKLVLGGSGSGKTSWLYARLAERAARGEYSILLVPEQFTSSTEGRIYRELGDEGSGYVESFSFTSLAERILSEEGGSAVQTLTDAGREIAERIYERHKLLTRWLEFLGVDPDRAAADACRMEHAVSNETFEKMKAHILGEI